MTTPAQDPIVILSFARTPMGSFQGSLSGASATELGATAVKAAVERAGVDANDIERIYMGCVLPAGLGQAPARQAALKAGLPQSVEATTVNKMCGSGMQAAIMGAEALGSGAVDLIITGGMESMTNAPYLLTKHRGGARIGHDRVMDHMFLDGLEDAYDKGRLMGTFAEDCASSFGFTREAQDAYAIASLTRAQAAIASGAFAAEIAPVATRSGEVSIDEQPGKARLDKIATLRPAFREGGTVTAANSSSISDGAAALVLMRASEAEARGLTPLARILGHSTHAHKPNLFPTAPIGALTKLSQQIGLALRDVDLFEVNEAFAVVAMAAMQALDLPQDKVNIHGGACALGHPIGASGARVLVTLLAALRHHGLKTGMATLCIGGGEATAMAVELL